MKAPLTSARVAELLRSGAPIAVPDGRSLFLHVRGVNLGYWNFRYRDGPRVTSKSLGRAPAVSLAQARLARDAYNTKRLADKSAAPRLVAKARPGLARPVGETFAAALVRYVAEKSNDWRGGPQGKTAQEWHRLAALPLADLTDAGIVAAVSARYGSIFGKSGRIAKGRIETVREYMQHGQVRRKAEKVEHHAALPWQAVPAFWSELAAIDTPQSRALRFLILTGARAGDVTGTSDKPPGTWAEIDGNVWTIPGERMKAGEEHAVPLCDVAMALLGERQADDVRLFATAQDSVYKLTKRIGAKLGHPEITMHGFRSTFRTWCGEHGHDRELAELSLAHKIGNKVEQAYQRGDYLNRRRAIMRQWADYATGSA
jgi:integrase